MWIKVCGATQQSDIDLLGGLPVDFVGLWYGVDGGHANMPFAEFAWLVTMSHATQRLQPVLVTFLNDAQALCEVVLRSHVGWIQLHGYQMPRVVLALKDALPDGVKIIKVLHVRGRSCVEQPLIRAYEQAGVDVFLLDAVTEEGRVGSTGRSLDAEVALSLVERLARPSLLAGGISSRNAHEYRALIRHPRFLGIDVDTNARGADGRLHPGNIAAISRAWGACEREEWDYVASLH